MRSGPARWRNLWLLVALAALAAIVYGTATTWGLPYAPVVWDPDGMLISAEPTSPAGLRPGDRILAVDGAPRDQFASRLRQALRAEGERAVVLTVERARQGQESPSPREVVSIRLDVGLFAPQRYLIYPVFALLAAAYWLLPLLVFLGAPGSREALLFYLMGELWAAALALGMLVPAGQGWGWVAIGVLSGALVPVMIHFHALFPRRTSLARRWAGRFGRWALPVLYAAGLVIGLRWLRTPLGYRDWASGWAVTTVWLGLGFVAAVALMTAAYLTARASLARQRIRLVVFGTVVGFAPFALLTVLTALVSEVWTLPFLAAVPAAYALAVWRYNLMGVDRFLRRGLVYLLVTVLLFGTYFAALAAVHALVPAQTAWQVVLGAAVALLAAVSFYPLRDLVQRLVDRLFYGGWYEYRGLVEQVGAALAHTLDAATLSDLLIRRVPQAMHLPGAALWLERGGRMELVGEVGVPAAACGAGAKAPPLRVELAAEQAVVPLAVAGQPLGVWVLAGRPAEGWGPEDGRILTALGRQAALAAQNVRLVGELRTKVAEVEAMHRRLLAAREEERAELARELHDGVIQDLVGLRYRLEAMGERQPAPQPSPTAVGEGMVGELHARVGMLIDELRRLCSNLRPPVLDQLGLAAALRALSREVSARGLPAQVHVEDLALPSGMDIALYRIAQEALSNSLQHAEASSAQVVLRRDGSEVVLSVADDGRGFEPAATRGKPGQFGLLGMAERAQALHGNLAVDSQPGEGTRITVRCPIQ